MVTLEAREKAGGAAPAPPEGSFTPFTSMGTATRTVIEIVHPYRRCRGRCSIRAKLCFGRARGGLPGEGRRHRSTRASPRPARAGPPLSERERGSHLRSRGCLAPPPSGGAGPAPAGRGGAARGRG